MAENMEHAPINKEKSEKEVLKRAIHKFNHLKKILHNGEEGHSYFSSREKGVKWLDIYFHEKEPNSHVIWYEKIKKLDEKNNSSLTAFLYFNPGLKEFKYNSYEAEVGPQGNYTGKVLNNFPGTENMKEPDGVIIGPEKAIQIMDRMIQEIEAAKKCKPINKSKELLSELKQDVGDVAPEKAA